MAQNEPLSNIIMNTTRVMIGLHNVLVEHHVCAKCVMNIYMYLKNYDMLMIVYNSEKAQSGKARQDKTRQHPDKKMFPWF